MHNKILIFDVETTGSDCFNDNIIEFGAVLVEKNNTSYKIVDKVDYLVKQDNKLPEKIVQLTNITDDMLKDGISENELFKNILNLIDDDTLLVAYNIQFDINFLQTLYRRHQNTNYIIKNDLLDMMSVYKDFHIYPHRLLNAIETYNCKTPNTHRACDDAEATWELMVLMADKLLKDGINFSYTPYINHIGFNPKYPIEDIKKLPHITYIGQPGAKRVILEYKKR